MKDPTKKTRKTAASTDQIEPAKAEAPAPKTSVRKTRVKTVEDMPAGVAKKPVAKTVKKVSLSDETVSGITKAEPKAPKPARAKRTAAPKKTAAAKASEATSPVKPKRQLKKAVQPISVAEPVAEVEELPRVDKLLAQPELPPLERENRARLQMQTPTRLYFYWSVRRDPWTMLRKAFGDDTGSYTLVLKLADLRSGSEQIFHADTEGSWWFDVRPDGEYRAEIGFFAPNRPYFRIVYSNIVETPRRKPSQRKASEAQWTVTADRFARVLDVAGFTRDAVDVAIAGDDLEASAAATRSALSSLVGHNGDELRNVEDEDIRFALVAIAEGQKLDHLRWKVSEELFAYLQTHENSLGESRAQDAIREHFDIEEFDLETEETGPAVYGSSLVNFPRARRTRRTSTTSFAPGSSHSYLRSFGAR